MSYKFQRLREKLREAIATGILTGKLAGERVLADRFGVNPKTIGKALNDLAARGVLRRRVGEGTFVASTLPSTSNTKHWLVLSEAGQEACATVRLLRDIHPELEVISDTNLLRPSLLNQVNAVIVLVKHVSNELVFDFLLRGIKVVSLSAEPRSFSTHAVFFDRQLEISRAIDHLLAHGHRHLVFVDGPSPSSAHLLVRTPAAQLETNIKIDCCAASDVASMINTGTRGFVCASTETAVDAKAQLESRGISVPLHASVIAVDSITEDPAVSGYFLRLSDKVQTVAELLRKNSMRPQTVWLPGVLIDRGSTAAAAPIAK